MRSIWNYVETDNRKPVSVDTLPLGRANVVGPSFLAFGPEPDLPPASSLSVSGGVALTRENNDAQWVDKVDGDDGRKHYVFGRISTQRTVAMTMRVNYTMTPTLSLQIYAEPFVSAGDYTGFKELVERPREGSEPALLALRLRRQRRISTSGRSAPPTCCVGSIEPARRCSSSGSRDARRTPRSAGFRFGRDFRGVFAAPASNVFLMKFSYWLNY